MAAVQGRIGRGIPPAVWLVTVLQLLVVVALTALFPNFRAPDEREHADLIVQVARGEAWPWPDPGTLPLSRGSAAASYTVSGRIPGPLHLADERLPLRELRPTYDEAGGLAPDSRLNQLVQHPPLYYVLGAGALALYPGWADAPFDRVFVVLRLWNALLLAAVPLLLWATARRLALPEPVPLLAALAPLAVPEYLHTASSVNNDNLFVLLAAILTLLLARVVTGDTGWRTALAVGALASLALLTKGFGLMLPAWIVLAYVVAAVRYRRFGVLLRLAVALVVSGAGLAWWYRNTVLYGVLQPSGYSVEPPSRPAVYSWSDGGAHWLSTLADKMTTLFFVHDQTGVGGHNATWTMAYIALALGVLATLVTLVRGPLRRADTLVLLAPTVGLLGIVALGTWQLWAATRLTGGMQGRYLYGGIAGLAVVVAAAAGALPMRVRRFAPLALLAFAGVIHAFYWIYTVQLFWLPSDGRDGLAAWTAAAGAIHNWYALPPVFLGVLGIALLGTAVALVVFLVRGAFESATVAEEDQRSAAEPVDDEDGTVVSGAGTAPADRRG